VQPPSYLRQGSVADRVEPSSRHVRCGGKRRPIPLGSASDTAGEKDRTGRGAPHNVRLGSKVPLM